MENIGPAMTNDQKKEGHAGSAGRVREEETRRACNHGGMPRAAEWI